MKRTALIAAVLALVAAACGGMESASAVASLDASGVTTTVASDDGDLDEEQALLELTECLRENGVDLADPTVDSDGNVQLGQPNFDADEGGSVRGGILQEAFGACEDLLEGVTLGRRGGDATERGDTFLEFAQCMRDNGYDMPDPDFSQAEPGDGEGNGPGAGGGPFGNLDRDDPAFQTAQSACEDILAGFGPGGGRFGGGPAGGGDGG